MTGWPGCLTWVSELRERRLASRVDHAEARASADVIAFKAFLECVLSEGFAVAQGVCRGLRWMVPVHGGVWIEARACEGARGNEQEKGIGWMPWRQEAMKDVARCENPGEAASRR